MFKTLKLSRNLKIWLTDDDRIGVELLFDRPEGGQACSVGTFDNFMQASTEFARNYIISAYRSGVYHYMSQAYHMAAMELLEADIHFITWFVKLQNERDS